MYSLIIERGDKIVHLRVQKYSSPKKTEKTITKKITNYQVDTKSNMI